MRFVFRNFFRDEKNIEILDRLKEYGVNMQAEETETVESVLTGKTVVVTGTLPTLGRKEASELIEKYGGKASSSVSKKTDYVLAGENAGSQADQSTGTWNSCYFRRTVERNAWNLVFTVLEDVAGHTVENRRAILIAREGFVRRYAN